jgi:hypothetical protein
MWRRLREWWLGLAIGLVYARKRPRRGRCWLAAVLVGALAHTVIILLTEGRR